MASHARSLVSRARLLAVPAAAAIALPVLATTGAGAAVRPENAASVASSASASASASSARPAATADKPAASPKSCSVKNATAKPASRPPAVPKKHTFFGGFSLGDGASSSDTAGSYQAFENKACRPLDIAHVYVNWNSNFPTDRFTTQAAQQGKVILLSWTGTDTITMDSGKVDDRIRQVADQVKAFHYPVLFEYRWEMDIPNNAAEVHTPQDYIAAYDRVYRIFHQQAVPNVSWVWCPSDWGFKEGTAQKYYPGDSKVDWVCTDAYDDPRLGKPTSDYQSPSLLMHSFVAWRHHHDKPMLVGEFGVPQSYPVSWRVKWFRQWRTYVKHHTGIRGMAYFDHVTPGTPSDHNVALGNNPQVIAAFQALARDPRFRDRDRADPNP